MRLRIIKTIIFLLIVNFCSAQLIENFDDGDFTNNPVWSGDATSFTVNASLQLQSTNAVASSTFYLSTPSTAAVNSEWDFSVNLKFATSGANYVDVFLVSNIPDVNNTGSGYFVRIGGTADEVSLYRNDAGTITKIIDGVDGRVGSSSNNIIRLKITNDAVNLWTLADSIPTAIPIVNTEGTVTDAAYTTSQYFGISVTQSTAGFFGKHYFDSIYGGPIIVDNIPPQIVSATVKGVNAIDVLFDEPVDLATSQTAPNYSLDNGIGNPSIATRDVGNFALVHLNFSTNFTDATTYTVSVSNVNDLANNTIAVGATTNFTYNAPHISSVTVISQNTIDVKFTEDMQQASTETVTNYSADNSLGNPSTAIRDASDSSLVHLTFATNFTDGLQNTLTVNNILSVSNGMIPPNTTATFTYFAPVVAAPDDIIINEIMAAPTGTLGLPNAEYVELYNRSSKNLNLNKWTIHDASGSSGVFQNIVLAPDSFLIICSATNLPALSAYGTAISVTSFPSLNNSGDDISIYDSTLQKINEADYTDAWYQDSSKISNGYSLERIDKNFPCPIALNWAASTAAVGGTPGALNSTNGNITDVTPPQVLYAHTNNSQSVTVFFDEVMDNATLNVASNFVINNGIGNPVSAVSTLYSNSVTLQVGTTLQTGITYTVTVTGVKDCSGNLIATNNAATFSYEPPVVNTITVISQNAIDVKFSEQMQQASAETISNYNVNNSIGNPSTAIRDAADSSIVHLTFATNFTDGLLDTLTVNNILSVSNDTVPPNSTVTFTWFAPVAPAPNDIIINEIMAAPNDLLGLPNAEYVELYNRSAKNLNLSNWTLSDATGSSGPVQNMVLAPGSYLIVCASANVGALSNFGNAISVSSFPSLNNSGDDISLFDNTGLKIDEVNYDETWYHDGAKISNGYSLERIDKNFPCPSSFNWAASINPDGGTPGTINSINGTYTDSEAPQVLNAAIIPSQTVTIVFNESMDANTLNNINAYSIDNGIGTPASANATPYSNTITLQVAGTFQSNVIYTLTINGVKDCAGNLISNNSTIRIAIPDTAKVSEILVNEILFNSYSGGYDFVEIYNNSNKVFDLSQLQIASADVSVDTLIYVYPITTEAYLIFPGDYVALTENALDIKTRYYSKNPNGIIAIGNLPTFNDDVGKVVVVNQNNIRVDEFRYDAKFQYPLLSNPEGVSLERLSFTRPTQDSTNWQSAAETVGFATPAYKNSQATEANTSTSNISITPEIFSPDDDGYNDVLSIRYHFNEPGLVANATVYDSRGRIIQYVARNVLIGEDATLSWNGINLDDEKAKIGIYILYSEIFNTKGDVKKYKNAFVVGGKLK
ncbi:MAG: lamin tail domain-containing protein [Bacteroidia bacterium]